jgi:hypothetical protein
VYTNRAGTRTQTVQVPVHKPCSFATSVRTVARRSVMEGDRVADEITRVFLQARQIRRYRKQARKVVSLERRA